MGISLSSKAIEDAVASTIASTQKRPTRGVTLDVKINVATLDKSVKKIEDFARLIENLSKEEACKGMRELIISATME